MKVTKCLVKVIGVAATLMAVSVDIRAQDTPYPSGPVTIIVPFAPGGTADILARQMADALRLEFGRPFIVDYKPGAATVLAARHVANSPPDGHTLLMSSATTSSINPVLMKNMPYRPDQLTPVALIAKVPFALAARKDFPANSVKEFIDYVRANPGKVSLAGQGTGGGSHLVGERLKAAANLNFLFVQYKGVGQGNADLLGGHVDLHSQGLPSALPFFAQGKAKPIAITSEARLPALPDVETFAEAGLPNMVVYTWYGLVAPAGTPRRILEALNAASNKALRSPAVEKTLSANLALPGGVSIEEFDAFIRKDIEEWRRVVEPLGLKLD